MSPHISAWRPILDYKYMKQKTTNAIPLLSTLMCLLLLTLMVSACHEEYDDYYTTATITLVPTDDSTVERIQGTVTVTNLSNGQSYSTSEFDNTSASLQVLRGPYSIAVEGSIQLRAADGTHSVHTFRATTNYCELMAHPTLITLDILLLS